MPTEQQNVAATVVNWTEFFKGVRDIYVQNVSNSQVSIEFETTPGNKVGYLFPRGRDPVNLTQSIPWEAIKASVDFRRMLNRRPQALQLMTEEEFLGYFRNKAVQTNQPVEQVMDEAFTRIQKIQNKQDYVTDKAPEPIHKVVEDSKEFGGKKRVESLDKIAEDEVLHPRILHLCQQVHAQLDDKEKMPAKELLNELEVLQSELKIDDWEHVRSHGYWKTVKNFARTQLEKFSGGESEGAE